MTKLAIIDLDGCIANNDARASLASTAARGFKGNEWNNVFFEALFIPERLKEDTLIDGSVVALRLLEEAGFHIVYLTSRPRSMYSVTVTWLTEHNLLPNGRDLVMKDLATHRWTKTDEWKAMQVHDLVMAFRPETTLFVDDEVKNRAKVSDLIIYKSCNMFLCDSLATAGRFAAAVIEGRTR